MAENRAKKVGTLAVSRLALWRYFSITIFLKLTLWRYIYNTLFITKGALRTVYILRTKKQAQSFS